eukprot:TRINITY_DN22935_c0_g1_i4.p1 TRINITY_DN22935_c0_g1~~TRINITY_DN22935_c0_g1_i4.p1  ORF type:complete len:736 (-),score=132.82 TRINITY_DN22935_c0_g1_i4:233-2440(-)
MSLNATETPDQNATGTAEIPEKEAALVLGVVQDGEGDVDGAEHASKEVMSEQVSVTVPGAMRGSGKDVTDASKQDADKNVVERLEEEPTAVSEGLPLLEDFAGESAVEMPKQALTAVAETLEDPGDESDTSKSVAEVTGHMPAAVSDVWQDDREDVESNVDKAKVQEISQPVRIRMTSADKLCARVLVIEWEDGGNLRQRWRSADDALENGWFEVEKLLPPTATNIAVQFQLKCPRKNLDVYAVDRHNGCSWVMLGKERYAPEVICLRVGAGHFSDPIDVVFELKGPVHRCFVHRAWNAARQGGTPEEWEFWDDEDSKPPCEGLPATLAAANDAISPQVFEDPKSYLRACECRLAASVQALLDVHRETLRALQGLDSSCNWNWLRANMGTSFSAGLMIAAVPSTILLPPLGIGLAIAGSVASTAAYGGDAMQERWSLGRLRRQLSWDNWNAFVVIDLLRAWVLALKETEPYLKKHAAPGVDDQLMSDPGKTKNQPSSSSTAIRMATGVVTTFSDEAAAALPVLGPAGVIVGAVMSTGIAIHGWTSQKFSQKEVRAKLADLKRRLICHQFLLARLGALRCPLCDLCISENEPAARCAAQLHVFHKSCVVGKSLNSCACCASTLDVDEGSLSTWANVLARQRSTQDAVDGTASSAAPPSLAPPSVQEGGGLEESFWHLLGCLDAVENRLATIELRLGKKVPETVQSSRSSRLLSDFSPFGNRSSKKKKEPLRNEEFF